MFEAGILPRPDFIIDGQFDEAVFLEHREKQLSIMLAQESIDGEELWTNYEQEETQIKIQLADLVLELLVKEIIDLLFT